MKFSDFTFRKDNHFIAMQYYGLILNRTFLVILTNDLLIGVKVNGLVSVETSGGNFITREIMENLAVKGDLNNPYAYIKSNYINKLFDYDLLDGSLLRVSKANFVLKRSEIERVYYDPTKKWGMGYYPHDGKVYVQTKDGKKREFIILGNQSGHAIADLIRDPSLFVHIR